MHIVVPIKQVPETEELSYDPSTRTLTRTGVTSVINPFDKRALTEAIRLRSEQGGSVTAITMGPQQARDALVECLGRGVDRAIHITGRVFAGSDTLATSHTLATALRSLHFDLILAGKWTTDSETGQVGPELAELLDLPQVTGATAIRVADGALRVTRETDTGFEEIETPLPALLTASERLIKPAKTRPEVLEEGLRRITADPGLIETLSAYDLGIEATGAGLSGSPTWVADLRPVTVARSRVLLSGDDAYPMARSLLLELKARGFPGGQAKAANVQPPPAPGEANPERRILAVAELLPDKGVPQLREVSFELVSEAARIASPVSGEAAALLIGHGVEACAGQLAACGAATILLADSPALDLYTTETYAWVLARAIVEYKPWAVLLPATSFGSDLAPRVAARLGLGLTADCLGLEVNGEGELLQLKPAFGGQVVGAILSRTRPQMATLRPGMLTSYAPDATRVAEVIDLSLAGLPASRVEVLQVIDEGDEGLALDNARLVVCIGSGVGGTDALADVGPLAAELGGWLRLQPEEVAIGGTRKVVDEGWLPRRQQIGITGHAVAPDLYLGLGVRGAFNHAVGILRSGTVVAVNKDPNAPIFDAADVGIVADWRRFVAALRRALAES